ncbi:MFS transporter [Bacillus niameyensis]|uniref:MFS transporter n=1 Tax=Bacillus niameyensis TaxID=1522308 RepID=UPI000782AB9F|nr:MFS transporter [Bacillus niameyensis]
MKSHRPLIPFILYLFVIGAINSFIVSYFPLYFQNKGLTTSEIGRFLAIGTFFGLLGQPIWGFISDKYKTVKKVLITVIIGSLLGMVWIFQTSSLVWIFVAGSFFYLFYNTLFPLSENLSKRMADQEGISFGVLRSWPAIGFAVLTLGSGFFFAKMGIGYLWLPMILLGMIALILAFRLKDAKTGTKKVDYRDMGKFFKNPTLLLFFLVLSFISLAHRMNDSFVSLHLLEIGGNEMLVGWLWFIAVLSEAVAFFTSAWWFRRPERPIHYIIIAGFLYLIRWFLIAFIDDPILLLAVQVFHGFCYAIFFMGAIEYLYKLLPKELQATGHMVFVLIVFGITGIIGSYAGGYIFDAFGGPTLYFIMTILTLIGIIGLLLFNGLGKEKVKVVE